MPNSLPYILISEPPMKLLIDTGCHPSLIRPYIAEKHYPETIFSSNTPIVTCAGSREANFKAHIPIFKEFFPLDDKLEFVLFNFHNYFDGIIGIRDLRKLDLNIDLKNKRLFNKRVSIPLHYRDEFDTQKIEIPPQSTEIKRLKINLPDCTVLIPEISNEDKSIIIPASILKIQDEFTHLEIINTGSKTKMFEINTDFLTPFVSNFNEIEYECFSIDQILTSNNKDDSNKDAPYPKLRTDHLNVEEKQALEKLVKQFKDIFYDMNNKLTFTNKAKHEIKTTDEIPVHTKSYRYPYVHKQEIRTQITKMLDDGIIRPSQSPWNSPIWIVPKKLDASGKQKWRIVVDYRKVNEKTIDDRYPLPNISDILDKLGRCQYFTTLDLASGFHQIELHPNSIEKTAFNVENGHYEYVRMPFGLKNAPATFQRVMDNVLKDLQNKICFVYMDDIIIFSTSLQEHICNLKKVFTKLKDAGFKIQLDKSEFLCKSIEFLGHVVTPEGVRPNQKKIEAIKKFPIPRTAKEIKSFLGLIGYYRKFINNFANLTKPLTKCLKKGMKIEHTPEFVNCFETCRKILMNDPILQHPDFSKPFNLTTDASNYAIGAVLSQGPVGKDLPVAYASRTLNPAEINYSTIEKELLSIVWAVKYFRPYLFGVKFNIITDHKPLEWLFSLKEPNSKLVRWRLKLEEYDYRIHYKKGKLNTNADALSRVEINAVDTEDNCSVIVNTGNVEDIENRNLELTEEEIQDILEKELLQYGQSSRPPEDAENTITIHQNILLNEINDDSNETVHTSLENPIMQIPYTEKVLNTFKNQVIVSLNKKDTLKVTKQKIFENNRLVVEIPITQVKTHFLNLIKTYFEPRKHYCVHFSHKEFEVPFIQTIQEFFKNKSFSLTISSLFVTDLQDEDERKLKLQQYHETKTCHRGIQENVNAIKKEYYWPNMYKDVTDYVNSCDMCQKNKYERHPHKIIFKPTPIGFEPFDHLHLDTYKYSGQSFVTIIDNFSKFGQAYPVNSLNSIEITDKIIRFISHYGIPRKITCDNGTEFRNENVQEFCKLHQIEIHYTTIYNPNSNSPVERFHSTISETLKVLQEQKPRETIANIMNYALLSYNNSIHSATNYTPFQIVRGKLDYKNPFELNDSDKVNQYIQDHSENIQILNALIHSKLLKKQQTNLEKVNQKRSNPELKIDEPLYRKETRFVKHKKCTQPYVRLNDPTIVNDNKIKSNSKIYHTSLLKPQRIISQVRSHGHQITEPNSSSYTDQRPLHKN